MQTSYTAFALMLLLTACQKQESAQEAMARSRGSLIDQVNTAGTGAPFFSEKTLNPTWNDQAAIVRMPAAAWMDQNGKTRDETLFTGRTTFVAFMFTSCSGFCPFVVQELKKAAKAVDRRDVQYVMISVDPEFDTPERLKTFAQAHGVDQPNWFFLRGPAVESLIKDTLVSQVMQKPLSRGRDFVHAGHFYVFDAKARLRGILNGTEIASASQARDLLQTF